jgi:transposase InsO family protein
MSKDEGTLRHDQWARLRFAIIGPLLAAPPSRGHLRQALLELSMKPWCHPVTKEPVFFSFSTIERWFYAARGEYRDPVGKLKRRIRKDSGLQSSLGQDLRGVLLTQYKKHKSWSMRLHYDNLLARLEEEAALGSLPSYSTVCRYMKAHALFKEKRKRHPHTQGAIRAACRLEHLEVRSFEAEYVNGLWHLDYHHGSKKVLTREGAWVTPHLLGILDDKSRLCCHLQWYLEETTEALVHGLCQAIQKRDLPRSLMTDRGSAMMAAETTRGLHTLSILHEPTLPYSPYQNAKQEVFWAQVEGRLMAMLEGVCDLTLSLLNEATQAWAEGEYNQRIHSETGKAPIQLFIHEKNVGRESPGSEELRCAFRAEESRTQRKSDGTISMKGKRYEVPTRYRHLKRVHVRYAGWDLSTLDLVDARSGAILCVLYPLDKTRNAEGQRKKLEPISNDPSGLDLTSMPSDDMAPLLKKLMAEYAATGIPPAYLPFENQVDKKKTSENKNHENNEELSE